MCGIIAKIGQISKSDSIDFLKKLEYRGYDGYGFGYIKNKELKVWKGFSLEDAKTEIKEDDFHNMVGHCRWASNGEKSLINCHPIRGGDNVLLVHNGTIDNYQELRTELEGKGFKFITNTDTEVIAHLASWFINNNTKAGDLVYRINEKLKGIWAYAFINNTFGMGNMLFASCNGCPLFYTENGYLSSDIESLRGLADSYDIVDDGDSLIAIHQSTELTPPDNGKAHNVYFIHEDKNNKTKLFQKHKFSETKMSVSSDYKPEDLMLKEIYEQPDLIKNFIRTTSHSRWRIYQSSGEASVNLFGCGSSYNAALLGKRYLEDFGAIDVNVQLASEFRLPPGYSDTDLNICITQSSETADCKEVVQYLRGRVLTITNNINGKIAQISKEKIDIGAGQEKAVAATKSFTSTCLALYYLAKDLSTYNKNTEPCYREDLAKKCQEILENKKIEEIAKEIYKYNHILFLARDYNFPIALEGALKMSEVAYIHSNAISSGELKHGNIALVTPDLLSIFIVSEEGPKLDRIKVNIQQIRSRNGKVLIICDENSKDSVYSLGDYIIEVPNLGNKYLQPILMNVPCQLLAYWCGKLKGNNIDHPRHLAKALSIY